MGGRDKECAGGVEVDGKGSAWMCPKAFVGNIQGKRWEGKKTREPRREMGNECSLPYALCENNAAA